MRWAAYRMFANFLWGKVGKGKRIPLPACFGETETKRTSVRNKFFFQSGMFIICFRPLMVFTEDLAGDHMSQWKILNKKLWTNNSNACFTKLFAVSAMYLWDCYVYYFNELACRVRMNYYKCKTTTGQICSWFGLYALISLDSDFLVQNVRVKVADRAASDSGEMSLLPRQICPWFGLFESFCLDCLQSWVSRIFSFSSISRECLRVGGWDFHRYIQHKTALNILKNSQKYFSPFKQPMNVNGYKGNPKSCLIINRSCSLICSVGMMNWEW